MNEHLEPRVTRVKRDFYIYAAILAMGIIFNMIDGGIEDYGDVFRAIVRIVGVIAIAQMLNLESKTIWWVAVVICGVFFALGVFASVMFLAVSSQFGFDTNSVFSIIVIIATTVVLGDAWWQSGQVLTNMK